MYKLLWTVVNIDYNLVKNMEKCMDCKEFVCRIRNKTCSFEEMTTLYLAYSMCPRYNRINAMPPEMDNLYKLYKLDGLEFNTYMEQLLPPCQLDWVQLEGSDVHTSSINFSRCDADVFQQFYSSQINNLCMTYNSLSHRDIYREQVITPIPLSKSDTKTFVRENPIWSFDNMMIFNGGFDTVPLHSQRAFSILIKKRENNHETICSTVDHNTASITIHNPNEIPLDTDYYEEQIKHPGSVTILVFEPKITIARDLDHYPPYQRGCLFSNERKLEMFKLYTKNNCDFECLINSFLKYCGCVPYMYPQQNNSVKICLQPCESPKYQCDCMPNCNSLMYEVKTREVSIADALTKKTVKSGAVVALKKSTHYTNIRYSIYGKEFLAYSLGVLGAFLGFSVTCMWQFMYLAFIRLWKFIQNSPSSSISPLPQN